MTLDFAPAALRSDRTAGQALRASRWLLLLSCAALAQPAPEQLPEPPGAPQESSIVRKGEPPSEELSRISIFGAPALGRGKRGAAMFLGFPLMGIRAGFGAAPALDLGLGLDSFYGAMNDFRAFAKWQLYGGRRWAWALAFEGGRAFFTESSATEGKGARWLTGRRDWNLAPGLIASFRGEAAQSARLFVDVRYQIAFDTEPYQRDPLGGTPPAVQVAGNVLLRGGAEMPISAKTSFLFVMGFDLHGRVEDSTVMPTFSLGVVTAI